MNINRTTCAAALLIHTGSIIYATYRPQNARSHQPENARTAQLSTSTVPFPQHSHPPCTDTIIQAHALARVWSIGSPQAHALLCLTARFRKVLRAARTSTLALPIAEKHAHRTSQAQTSCFPGTRTGQAQAPKLRRKL